VRGSGRGAENEYPNYDFSSVAVQVANAFVHVVGYAAPGQGVRPKPQRGPAVAILIFGG
jgi:hypothetical protein